MAEILLEALEEIPRNKKELTAAYEVHDFKSIVRLDVCFLPAWARENIEIALDGNAVVRHAQVCEQRGDAQTIGDFAALAVDCNGHLG